MKAKNAETSTVTIEARARVIDVGGRTSQDLGMGRIVGQILAYLYLQPNECSMDRICEELGLSKAAVSTSARQLESLGLICRVWKKGDRRTFYRTADDIVSALRQGLLVFFGQKMQQVSGELDAASALLAESADRDQEAAFVLGRVKRAQALRNRLAAILRSPIVKLFAR